MKKFHLKTWDIAAKTVVVLVIVIAVLYIISTLGTDGKTLSIIIAVLGIFYLGGKDSGAFLKAIVTRGSKDD